MKTDDLYLEVATCDRCAERVYRVGNTEYKAKGSWQHADSSQRHVVHVSEQQKPTRQPLISHPEVWHVTKWDVVDGDTMGATVDCGHCGGWGTVDDGTPQPPTCTECTGDGSLHREYGAPSTSRAAANMIARCFPPGIINVEHCRQALEEVAGSTGPVAATGPDPMSQLTKDDVTHLLEIVHRIPEDKWATYGGDVYTVAGIAEVIGYRYEG